MQIFADTDFKTVLNQYHTWGCPIYILKDPDQQPKWEPRSRAGIYLGHSPCHAGTVALVLNPHTLHVSPQFHVVFDDDFTTVPYLRSGEEPPQWKDLVAKSSEISTDKNFDLASEWTSDHFQIDESQIDPLHPVGNDSTPSSSPPNVDSVTFENGNAPSEGATASSLSGPDKALLMPTLHLILTN